MRKRQVFYTDDMRHKIAAEYRTARKKEKRPLAARYNISINTIASWLRQGYGQTKPKPVSDPPKVDWQTRLVDHLFDGHATGELSDVQLRNIIRILVGSRRA